MLNFIQNAIIKYTMQNITICFFPFQTYFKNIIKIFEQIQKSKSKINWILPKHNNIIEILDKSLWTYSQLSFLPHGTEYDEYPEKQPILLSHKSFSISHPYLFLSKYHPLSNDKQEILSISQLSWQKWMENYQKIIIAFSMEDYDQFNEYLRYYFIKDKLTDSSNHPPQNHDLSMFFSSYRDKNISFTSYHETNKTFINQKIHF